MSGNPVDVLAMLRAEAKNLHVAHNAAGGRMRECLAERHGNMSEAIAAVAELIEAGKQLLPRNLCLNNPRWPDSTEIPLTATLGELRALAAALSSVTGEKA